jgi:ribosome biogenesis GTPase
MAVGTVIRIEGPTAIVRVDGIERRAWIRGALKSGRRTSTHVLAVGDLVRVDEDAADQPVIGFVEERRNLVARADPGDLRRCHTIAANVDRIVCVHAFRDPPLNLRSLDRFLLIAHASGVPATIVLNKVDLLAGRRPKEIDAYEAIGVEVLSTSARALIGIEELRARLAGAITVLLGPSGVGKSSLLNVLFPGLELRTRPVSRGTSRGVHTTVRVEWCDLPEGGTVLDTPGLRLTRPWGITSQSLATAFPEFRGVGPCRFSDCMHRDEPGCEVHSALSHGVVAAHRFASYLRILNALEVEEKREKRTAG